MATIADAYKQNNAWQTYNLDRSRNPIDVFDHFKSDLRTQYQESYPRSQYQELYPQLLTAGISLDDCVGNNKSLSETALIASLAAHQTGSLWSFKSPIMTDHPYFSQSYYSTQSSPVDQRQYPQDGYQTRELCTVQPTPWADKRDWTFTAPLNYVETPHPTPPQSHWDVSHSTDMSSQLFSYPAGQWLVNDFSETSPLPSTEQETGYITHCVSQSTSEYSPVSSVSPSFQGLTGGVVEASPQAYAHYLYRCLLQAPGHKMALGDIYHWLLLHCDKIRESSGKGWQNSIRHNLSMNKVSICLLYYNISSCD